MKQIYFLLVVTALYLHSLVPLLQEFRNCTPEERFELQTGPCILSSTLLYVSLVRFAIVFLSK